MRTLLGRKGPPDGIGGIDWGHSRTQGLEFFAPLTAPYDLRDLVSESRATRTGLETYITPEQGPPGLLFGASNYADFGAGPSAIGPSTPFSVAWTQEYIAGTSDNTVIEISFQAGASTFIVYQNFGGGSYGFSAGPRGTNPPSWAAANGGSVPAWTNGRPQRCLLRSTAGNTSTGSAWTLWIDGVLQSQGVAQAITGNTNTVFRVGAIDGGGSPFDGSITDLRLWSRVLSDEEAEIESTIQGSWELYGPAQIWIPVGAATGNANAPAASFAWDWSFSGGAASAVQNVSAPAAAFAWTWAFNGGAASVDGSVDAPGASFAWVLALSAGAASVTANPDAPGAALAWNWAFSGGAASTPSGTTTLPAVVIYLGDNMGIGTDGRPVAVLFI